MAASACRLVAGRVDAAQASRGVPVGAAGIARKWHLVRARQVYVEESPEVALELRRASSVHGDGVRSSAADERAPHALPMSGAGPAPRPAMATIQSAPGSVAAGGATTGAVLDSHPTLRAWAGAAPERGSTERGDAPHTLAVEPNLAGGWAAVTRHAAVPVLCYHM